MMKSLFGGGAVLTAALLLCSLTFYSPALFAENRPDDDARTASTTTSTLINISHESGTLSGALLAAMPRIALAGNSKDAGKRAHAASPNTKLEDANTLTEPAQRFTATAYALPGRTASGQTVRRGLIAADRSLPLGTRVRLDAGNYSGEYLVADRGSRVRGRIIDIWVPSNGEAVRFGRRPVKLTILGYGGKKAPKRTAKTRP
ncbi:MAG TPA: 3D domain-containing protein [Pyrinomonadaceae bacterium]|nr:3D domain-containing protein [Pyrinomonadaceae bacterium]